jgi:hypothetical protein
MEISLHSRAGAPVEAAMDKLEKSSHAAAHDS